MGAIQATSAANPSADAQAQRDRSVANDAQDGLAATQPATLVALLGVVAPHDAALELLPSSLDVECSGQRLALVRCAMRFDAAAGHHTQNVGARLSVRHHFPGTLRFTRVDVYFTDARYDHSFLDEDAPDAQQARIGLK